MLSLSVFTACQSAPASEASSTPEATATAEPTATPEATPTAEPTQAPSTDPENMNLLTGLPTLSEEAIGKRPVAVMVNNVDAALPQYGISAADVIFEIPVEGDLTRLMALYGAVEYNDVFQRAACLSPSLWVSPSKVIQMIAKAQIKNDTCIYMDYGSEEMFNHAATAEALISISHMLLTKRVNLAFRIVPGGTHSEASWEQQIPIFMDCLGL